MQESMYLSFNFREINFGKIWNSNIGIFTISETLNFEFGKVETWKMAQIYSNQNSEHLKVPKMTFIDCLNSL